MPVLLKVGACDDVLMRLQLHSNPWGQRVNHNSTKAVTIVLGAIPVHTGDCTFNEYRQTQLYLIQNIHEGDDGNRNMI